MISKVRAVVVSWNSSASLDRCLACLASTQWAGQLEVVVVDNGSTDGSTEDWDRRHPGVDLRRTGANLGFGAAANRALMDVDDVDAVALINPDAFVEPTWLEPLAAELDRDPKTGAVCPKILLERPDPSGRDILNNAGSQLGWRWEPHDRGLGEIDVGQYDQAQDVWGWCGGAVLLRTAYLRSVGPFDEQLFLYCEDTDLSWRGRKLGWRCRYVPASVVRHVHRASSGGERTPLLDYLNRRNRLVVVTRHGGVRGAAIVWVRATGGILLATLRLLGAALARRPVDMASLRRRIQAALDASRLLRGRPLPVATGGPTAGHSVESAL